MHFWYRPEEFKMFDGQYFVEKWSSRIALTAFVIGMGCYIPYMVFGPGLDLLAGTQLLHLDFDEASQYRREMMRNQERGQGNLLVLVASNFLFPLT